MKTHLSRTSSIFAVSLSLVAFSLPGIAQQPTARQQQQIQQQEPQLPELLVQDLDSETLRVAVPRECDGIKPVVQTHNGVTGVSPSLALASYLNGKPHKGYNNPAVNTYFGDSFKLQNCRVCYATIAVNVQHYGDNWINDSLTVGVAPFGSGNVFISGRIWVPPTPNPKTITWVVPVGLLNTYLMSGSLPPKSAEAFIQDDTTIHSATLSVWYY
jgi:hypothetical protein